tara:strand:+ start:211 stop:1158 length:948 start_codon:yes stop_codon:yes gene_type:complete
MNILVTGGAGFIGSNLVERLLKLNHKVVILDNFSTGKKRFIQTALKNKNCLLIEDDLLDKNVIIKACENIDAIFHMAANADVRYGIEKPTIDLEQNTIVTSNVLEAARKQNVKKFIFSSTGSIYGNSEQIPTPENANFPIQTSFYGASKLACEGLISAYSEAYDIQSFIFRFVSIMGERYTHGHVYDFYAQLRNDPKELKVLGNGNQKKSYLYVQDCINAMLVSLEKNSPKINIYNLGTNEYITVNESINIICKYLNVNPTLSYSGGQSGWIGDNPFIWLDCGKIYSEGITPKLNIEESVIKTIGWIKNNNWIYD